MCFYEQVFYNAALLSMKVFFLESKTNITLSDQENKFITAISSRYQKKRMQINGENVLVDILR